ncbi:tyrosine-protein phosphatase non-receptor type 1 isoform X2 [Engraulis encrasicolus]
MEEAQRSYILTQGPLPNTCGHFWEMVWEQKTRGVVMLNRVIEKGSVKCAQYWPLEEREAVFEDTHFKLTLVSEDVKSFYTVRQLELTNLQLDESREILHFHYTSWPDFGVPESPASFLTFLMCVRQSGCLGSPHTHANAHTHPDGDTHVGPAVVHCSAGIGRSGTFCLVDTCLLLMCLREDPSSVCIRDVLLEMRKCRMGLIQTADQLRFSYLAVIEGARNIMGHDSLQESWAELSNEDVPDFKPPSPPPWSHPDEHNGSPQHTHINSDLRRRHVGVDAPPVPPPRPPLAQDSIPMATAASVAASVPPPKPPRTPEEAPSSPPASSAPAPPSPCPAATAPCGGPPSALPAGPPAPWSPLLANMCVCTALALGAYVCYRTCFH